MNYEITQAIASPELIAEVTDAIVQAMAFDLVGVDLNDDAAINGRLKRLRYSPSNIKLCRAQAIPVARKNTAAGQAPAIYRDDDGNII